MRGLTDPIRRLPDERGEMADDACVLPEGLSITFDPAIDGGGWPGPLDGRDAVVGESWLGPLGLLARLEVELGLVAIHATPLERVTDLAAQLATCPGWWSASASHDALGTARRLLRDRDHLALAGWCGEPLGERLDALWRVTQPARDGVVERLRAIEQSLDRDRDVGVSSIRVCSPIASLPYLWRLVFTRLRVRGVRIDEVSLPTAGAGLDDLARARCTPFEPTGDGSLVLLRGHGVLACADEVAAHLAALDSLDGVVVIGGDDILDAAFARHGLPRLGATGDAPASTTLVRLALEAAFEPMEPADLHALLCLDPGPVPRRVARRLVDALRSLPSRRSQQWRDALADGLARCDDAWRDDVQARLELLLPAVAHRDARVEVGPLDARLAAISTWARARMTAQPTLAAVATLAEEARRLVRTCGAPALSLVAIRRLCDELDARGGRRTPAEAGIASVADPGAILGFARHIIWWRFTRESAPVPSRFRLTVDERARLAAHGIEAPDLGRQMEAEAVRWRRPLDLARETILLVCPQTSDAGDAAFPHPLWDELRAAMSRPESAALLTRHRAPAARRRPIEARPLPIPATRVQVSPTIAAQLGLREVESPSSLESLIGCSLGWTLHYHGRLRAGRSAGPSAPSPLLYGTLAHRILAATFGAGALGADAAAARAESLVDAELAASCESLGLPRHQLERSTVRHAIVATARALGRLLERSGASVHASEQRIAGVVGDLAISGTPDLVLANPDAILDFKWGRKNCRDKLENGSALQLALYAALHSPSADAQIAYLTLQSQELLAPSGTTLPGARRMGSASAQAIVAGALVSIRARRDELARGELLAPAADGTEDLPSGLDATRLAIAPSCTYCDFTVVCGKAVSQ